MANRRRGGGDGGSISRRIEQQRNYDQEPELRPGPDEVEDVNEVNDVQPKIKGVKEDKAKEKAVDGSTLFPLFMMLLLDLISFTVILPLLPALLQYYKENDSSGVYWVLSKWAKTLGVFLGAPNEDKSEQVLIGGLLGSLFCVLQFISAPFFGALSDREGRKKALILCTLGICISHLVWYLSSNFIFFILSRIIGGFSRANVSLCSAIVADDCPPAMRPKGMAMIGIAFSIGFTVGPSIGAYFAVNSSLFTPALASIILSLMSFVIIICFVEETLPKRERANECTAKLLDYTWPPYLFDFKLVSDGSKLKPIGWIYFVHIFIYSGLEFTLTFLTQSKLNYTSKEQGKMFTFIGVTMAILQGTLTRRLTPETERGAVGVGMLIMIPAFMIIGFSQDTIQLIFGLFCYSIGSAIITPCLTSIAASKVTKPNEKGVALGTFRSLGALARSFGPLVASALFWYTGPTVAYSIGAVSFLIPLSIFLLYL